MKFKSLLVFITLFCCILHVKAQDAVNYYIIFDASGSVGTLDRKNNLQNSALQLLDISNDREKEYNNALSFFMSCFGENINDTMSYRKSDDVKQMLQKVILDKTKKSRTQKHSDMKEALKIIVQKVRNKVESGSGVFIFTDGYFDYDKDIHQNGNQNLTDRNSKIRDYKDSVDLLIFEIEKYVGPGKVFFIQTSPNKPQFMFSNKSDQYNKKLPYVINDSCMYSKNYFWISSDVAVDNPLYKNHLEQFIYSANVAIITPNELPLNNEREVAITLQEIFSLSNNFKQSGAIAPKYTNTLDVLLKKNELTGKEVLYIKSMLADLVNDESLVSYRNELFANAFLSKSQKSLPLSLVALTESYHPAKMTNLSNEVKQNKGWENFEQNMIKGTAAYLVKRAKQEVVYSFIDNLNRYFKNDPDKEKYMFTFFPTVWQFSENENNLPDVLALRDAFKKDIKNIPQAISNNSELIKTPSMYTLWVFMRYYDELLNTGNMEQTFRVLANEVKQNKDIIKLSQKDPTFLFQSIDLSLNLISYLNDNDIAAVYSSHNRDSMSALSKMLYILSIDTSILRDTSIVFHNLHQVSKIISKIYSDYDIAKKQIQTLRTLLDKPPTADFDGYRKYQRDLLLDILHRSGSLITSGAELIALQDIKDSVNNIVKNRNIINAAQNGIESWFNIQNENYTQAMLNLFSAGVIFAKKGEKMQDILMISGEVASSQSAEDVSNILARYMLPVASYKTKRHSKYSIMVNAYLGAGWNFYSKDGSSGLAIHAPIGIEFSKNIRICKSANWYSSVSIMPTLFDLGNVVKYQEFNRQTTDSGSVISFERIFSPGIIVSWGISNKIPLSIIAGYQSNPNRFLVGTAFDLPLLGIWKKNRLR